VSGFAGVIRLDDRNVDAETVACLAAAVAHRGPDAQGAWADERAAFVHAMLRTTPESANETQPLLDRELVIVADVRLDNRDDLVRALSIEPAATDAAFIAAAYRKWGSDCPRHLEGDFSFAIWNREERVLFCARDPFGVKPFVYAFLPGKLFAFGSEVRAVLANPEVPRDLDESRIADFLVLYFDDNERTFYQALKRLPGASTLLVRDGVITTTTFWFARDVRGLKLAGGDAAYAEGFLEHFARAIRVRMRVPRTSDLAALMSGGLDSSSISCFVRDEFRAMGAGPLPVFSWIFSDVMSADEREYQKAVLTEGGMRSFTLDSAVVDSSPWTDLEVLLPDGPVFAANYYLNTRVAEFARNNSIRVLLDGLGGDSTISRGAGRFVELFWRGRMGTLVRELGALRDRRGSHEPLPLLFAQHVLARILPIPMLRAARRLRPPRTTTPALAILHPRLARVTHAKERRRAYRTERQEHVLQFESPMMGEGLELFDRMMAGFGVESRYPFFDRRLAEYCISLPADQKLSDGYSRIVARRAMAGILPEAVRWRAGKGKQGLHAVRALRDTRATFDDLFFNDASALEPYVDMDVLRRTYSIFMDDQKEDLKVAMQLWLAGVLGRWLRRANILFPVPNAAKIAPLQLGLDRRHDGNPRAGLFD
jgi:asparagine synthase (glutamine-hydrolysing)